MSKGNECFQSMIRENAVGAQILKCRRLTLCSALLNLSPFPESPYIGCILSRLCATYPPPCSWCVTLATSALAQQSAQQPAPKPAPKPEDSEVWQPEPKVVTPGATCGAAPSDAIILFDGKNLDEWVSAPR
jgi:hypothetical protein